MKPKVRKYRSLGGYLGQLEHFWIIDMRHIQAVRREGWSCQATIPLP
jgi:hypothetical protein